MDDNNFQFFTGRKVHTFGNEVYFKCYFFFVTMKFTIYYKLDPKTIVIIKRMAGDKIAFTYEQHIVQHYFLA